MNTNFLLAILFIGQIESASAASLITNPPTALFPVYANFDGTPHRTRFPQSTVFGYDSWRVASNWSIDWSWWHKAPEQQQLSNRIQGGFASVGIESYVPVFYAGW